MQCFEDRQDVEEWLETLDYEGFWRAIAPFGLAIQSRESCDRQIASGSVEETLVLRVLKGLARLELVQRYELKQRDLAPWFSLH